MERSREYDDIAVALAEVRPAPQPDFTAELDELAASGFSRDSRARRRTPLAALADRLRGLSPQRLLFATSGAALTSIAVATVIVASIDSGATTETIDGGGGAQTTRSQSSDGTGQPTRLRFLNATPAPEGRPAKPSSSSAGQDLSASSAQGARSETQSSDKLHSGDRLELQRALGELRGQNASAHPGSDSLVPFGTSLRHRDIERSARITLLAEPGDVASDSAEVFGAVHDARGIVLHSTTTEGRNAEARFELLIPSRNLGDALAAFSAIDEVGSRHEATIDITAPTVSVEEQLQDSRAKIDGLLAQLAAAETESERETVEVELRRERRYAATLQAQLERLQRRADYSRVSLRIETSSSSSSSSGGWGVDDALGDAGHILAIAAAVTIVGLAIVGPLALIGLLAWLAHRLWLPSPRPRPHPTANPALTSCFIPHSGSYHELTPL